jgi:hypothetical protein
VFDRVEVELHPGFESTGRSPALQLERQRRSVGSREVDVGTVGACAGGDLGIVEHDPGREVGQSCRHLRRIDRDLLLARASIGVERAVLDDGRGVARRGDVIEAQDLTASPEEQQCDQPHHRIIALSG